MERAKTKVRIIALFDGDCMMCNRFISILDNAGQGSCASLVVTPSSQRFLQMTGIEMSMIDLKSKSRNTIMVCTREEKNKVLEKSRAIAKLMSATKDIKLRLLSRMIMITPKWIADYAYDVIGRHRKSMPVKKCSLKKLEWLVIDE